MLIKKSATAAPVTEDNAGETTEDKPKEGDEKKIPLPEHDVEWIDFGMMGTLTSKQRQILLDIVTSVVMHDAYGLKRTVMQIAHPRGEIDHGFILEMCEDL